MVNLGNTNVPQNRTKRQAILAFICQNLDESGKAPSMRKIAEAVGVNLSTIAGYISRMVREGLLVPIDTKYKGHRRYVPAEGAYKALADMNFGKKSMN